MVYICLISSGWGNVVAIPSCVADIALWAIFVAVACPLFSNVELLSFSLELIISIDDLDTFDTNFAADDEDTDSVVVFVSVTVTTDESFSVISSALLGSEEPVSSLELCSTAITYASSPLSIKLCNTG